MKIEMDITVTRWICEICHLIESGNKNKPGFSCRRNPGRTDDGCVARRYFFHDDLIEAGMTPEALDEIDEKHMEKVHRWMRGEKE